MNLRNSEYGRYLFNDEQLQTKAMEDAQNLENREKARIAEEFDKNSKQVVSQKRKKLLNKRPKQQMGNAKIVGDEQTSYSGNRNYNESTLKAMAPKILNVMKTYHSHHKVNSLCDCAEPSVLVNQLTRDFGKRKLSKEELVPWLRQVKIGKTFVGHNILPPCITCQLWLADDPSGNRQYVIKQEFINKVAGDPAPQAKTPTKQSKPKSVNIYDLLLDDN